MKSVPFYSPRYKNDDKRIFPGSLFQVDIKTYTFCVFRLIILSETHVRQVYESLNIAKVSVMSNKRYWIEA